MENLQKTQKNIIFYKIFVENIGKAPKMMPGDTQSEKMDPQGEQKWAKRIKKWAKGSQKEAKGSQKAAKGSQKGAKGSPKGAKRAPKGGQNDPKMLPKCIPRPSWQKSSKLVIFWP